MQCAQKFEPLFINVNKNASNVGCSTAPRRNTPNTAARNHDHRAKCCQHKTSHTPVKIGRQTQGDSNITNKRNTSNNALLSTTKTYRGPDDSQSSFATTQTRFPVTRLQNCPISVFLRAAFTSATTFLGCCVFTKTNLSSHQSLNLWSALRYNYSTTSSTTNKLDTGKNLKKKGVGGGGGFEGLVFKRL